MESGENLPAQFGPYRTIRVLGQGGMGAVLEVEHVQTGGRYALKLIHSQVMAAIDLERFRREAEVMGQLDHPNLARIHAAHLEPPQAYLVLDLYPGGSLQDRLASGPLPIEQALRYARQLAEGLVHAHDHGVLHRDIKPENVLINDRDEAVLADFGLSRQGEGERMTHTGELLGTPLYMAPEQVNDAKRVGPASDVYSLGAVLYRTLTGHPPIEQSSSVIATLTRVLEEPPRPPRELRAEIPPALDALLLRALSKGPHERPSAKQFAETLLGPLGDAGTAPRRGKRGLVVAAVAALVLAAGAATLALSTSSPQTPEPTPSSPKPTHKQPAAPVLQPPQWVVSLHERHVSLTLSDEQRMISILASCEVALGAERHTHWTLTPVRVRTWSGKNARVLPEDHPLVPGPLTARFDSRGVYVDTLSEVAAHEPKPETFKHLAWRWLHPAGLDELVKGLLALPSKRKAAVLGGQLTTDAGKGLVGAVLPASDGWASIQVVRVATAEEPPDDARTVRLTSRGKTREVHEAALRALNGLTLSDPLTGTVEVPTPAARQRAAARPPYEPVGSTENPIVYARPWGAPLGRLPLTMASLELTRSNGWSAIGWRGGEGWVRSSTLARSPLVRWAGIVSTKHDTSLDVFDQDRKTRVGSLPHGATVAVLHASLIRSFPSVHPAVHIPAFGSWVHVEWGDRRGLVKASLPNDRYTSYLVYILLLAPTVEHETEVTRGRVPEEPMGREH